MSAIKIVENFKSNLKPNFILKLLIKLCLLINDIRQNKAIRILAMRWLLNIKNTFYFNFEKYMNVFSYYLCPFPFDNVSVCLEKLKTLFLFYDSITEADTIGIIHSMAIMENFKYFPIYSEHVKALFKGYSFIILLFPYKRFIKLLCHILRNNLKEVPRILPNLINLLRLIKQLCEIDSNTLMMANLNQRNIKLNFNKNAFNITLKIEDSDFETNNIKLMNDYKKMNFEEIYKYLLVKLSKFIAKFNSHAKLDKYYELFIEIAKVKLFIFVI